MGKLIDFFSKIDPQKAFDTVSKGLDQLALTNEERLEYNKNAADGMVEFYKLTLSENTIRSKTRRFIAKAIIINMLLIVNLCVAMVIMGKNIDGIIDVVSTFGLAWAFITVIIFFFGGYYKDKYSLKQKINPKK